ncbi:small ubiquitin protein [Novymonas esmeraldas]|uniref:Small ubiquitin protein n=1 Tax=Novymonas esmeraldas TaxID=1808958 RepID=A0AAW0FD07_9TRYP
MENAEHPNPHPDGSGGDAPAPVKAEAVAAAASAQQISLKVVNADGAEMFFKIKRGTQLKKLIDAYCKKQGISRGSVRFLFDGAPIDESKTPEDLGMEDDDVIDAMVEQTGGALAPSRH